MFGYLDPPHFFSQLFVYFINLVVPPSLRLNFCGHNIMRVPGHHTLAYCLLLAGTARRVKQQEVLAVQMCRLVEKTWEGRGTPNFSRCVLKQVAETFRYFFPSLY